MFTTLLLTILSFRPVFAADADPAATAAADMTFKGKLFAPDSPHRRGDVTVGKKSISVELHGVFKTESHAYSYSKMSSVHAKRGLFHTTIAMVMEDDKNGGEIDIRTRPKYYKEVNALLKDKM